MNSVWLIYPNKLPHAGKDTQKKKHHLNIYSYQNNYQKLKISKFMCLLISELQLGVNIYNGLC